MHHFVPPLNCDWLNTAQRIQQLVLLLMMVIISNKLNQTDMLSTCVCLFSNVFVYDCRMTRLIHNTVCMVCTMFNICTQYKQNRQNCAAATRWMDGCLFDICVYSRVLQRLSAAIGMLLQSHDACASLNRHVRSKRINTCLLSFLYFMSSCQYCRFTYFARLCRFRLKSAISTIEHSKQILIIIIICKWFNITYCMRSGKIHSFICKEEKNSSDWLTI